MRFVGAVVVIACLLMVGCSPASTGTAASPEPSSTVVAHDSGPSRSESATGTLKGWFAQDESARIDVPAANQPADAVGYFAVTPTDDDAKQSQGAVVTRVYLTADTKTELNADPLDAAACAGTWIWIDYRMVGESLVADRVYAPVGLAF